MCFLMLPVPVAMLNDGFAFPDAALVMQLHLICMYLPSFLAGRLVPRLGAGNVQVLGALVLVAATLVFDDGGSMAHYVAGEILNVRAGDAKRLRLRASAAARADAALSFLS